MQCNCVERIGEQLREHNVALACLAIQFGDKQHDGRVAITLETEWIDKSKAPRGRKNRPPTMVASHCPFCGAPVDRTEVRTEAV